MRWIPAKKDEFSKCPVAVASGRDKGSMLLLAYKCPGCMAWEISRKKLQARQYNWTLDLHSRVFAVDERLVNKDNKENKN